MSNEDLGKYLYEHIPLTAAMHLSVLEASRGQVVLAAPLAPNLNHRQTAFGGSISTLATVAAWSWLYLDALELGFPVRLVIRSNRVEYLKPVEGEFLANCSAPSLQSLETYHEGLRRKGKGRIELGATVSEGGGLAATFVGTFVGIRHDGP